MEIVLELSAPARYTAKLNTSSAKGKNRAEQASLHVALENASVEKDIRKGVNIRGSLFKGMSVSDSKGGETVLQFNFQDARRFDAVQKPTPAALSCGWLAAARSCPLSATQKPDSPMRNPQRKTRQQWPMLAAPSLQPALAAPGARYGPPARPDGTHGIY